MYLAVFQYSPNVTGPTSVHNYVHSNQLHGNELGLRHVFTHCDGGHGTSGPDSFKGSLGQALMTEVHKMKVVQFQPVATPLADIDEEVQKCLSRDQLLRYQ